MFEKTELIIGKENIEKIKNASILLVGVGGVGGYAFESLLRVGVGTIIIVDNDTFDETNLNRQLHATKETINLNKIDVLEKHASSIGNTKIIKINKFLTKENIKEIFKYKVDYVVDAIDSMDAKKELIRYCLKNRLKIISSMGMGGKIDASKIKIMKIKDTSYDPIAKEIRKMIRNEKLSDKLIVVSSEEKAVITSPIGSISYVPAIAGLLCTNYIINDIIK